MMDGVLCEVVSCHLMHVVRGQATYSVVFQEFTVCLKCYLSPDMVCILDEIGGDLPPRRGPGTCPS
jgi:exopolysaccharide biosynthesis predicted pyruvyltransferase EpsI